MGVYGLARIDRPPAVTNVHNDESKSPDVASTVALWCVISIVLVALVEIEVWMQIGVWTRSAAISFAVVISIFVPRTGVAVWPKASVGYALVPGNQLSYLAAFRVVCRIIQKCGAPTK